MKTPEIPSGSVVVGYDGSEDADKALEWATHQAALERRDLVVLHSHTPYIPYTSQGVDFAFLLDTLEADAQSLLDRAAARVRTLRDDVRPILVNRQVDPREALLAAAERATLVVVGCRGRGPVARLLLGSVSAAITAHAACPVVVVRGADVLPGARVVVAADSSRASLPVVEFAFRQAELRALPLSVVHCFSEVVPGRSDEEHGSDGLRRLLSESVAGLSEKFPDVVVTLELERGPAHQVLAGDSASADLVVVGHHRTRSAGGRLHPSVATSVREHSRCPVAVVPEGPHR